MRSGIHSFKKTVLLLSAATRYSDVGSKQTVPAHGKTTQPWQDGAGVAAVKTECRTWLSFLSRTRSNANQPIAGPGRISGEVKDLERYQPDILKHPGLMKGHIGFLGECLLGHLRYNFTG